MVVLAEKEEEDKGNDDIDLGHRDTIDWSAGEVIITKVAVS